MSRHHKLHLVYIHTYIHNILFFIKMSRHPNLTSYFCSLYTLFYLKLKIAPQLK